MVSIPAPVPFCLGLIWVYCDQSTELSLLFVWIFLFAFEIEPKGMRFVRGNKGAAIEENKIIISKAAKRINLCKKHENNINIYLQNLIRGM